MPKTQIYLMPGLAASPSIFEYLSLNPDVFDLHFLEWIVPDSKNEDLQSYCLRLKEQINHPSPVLIGVSFGGIIVQELSKLIDTQNLIIISSIKDPSEMPRRLEFLKNSMAYKLFPSRQIARINDFSYFAVHKRLKKKADLYNKYLSVRNEKYLNWAIYQVLHWKPDRRFQEVIHIHGDRDEIFPIKHIKDCIIVPNGTHAMIVVKARRISKILEKILIK